MKFLFYFLLFLSCYTAVCAQSPDNDTTFVTRAVNNARNESGRILEINSGLYEGRRYKEVQVGSDDVGQPYWSDGEWKEGSVSYDGQSFSNVEMNYNLISDKIVIVNPYSGWKIQLVSERLASFEMIGHRFQRISQGRPAMDDGFYEVLVSGKVSLFKRDVKRIQPTIKLRKIISDYRETVTYFILKDGVYRQVRSKSSLLKMFADQKVQLRNLLSKDKSVKDRESWMKRATTYYNESGAEK